MNNTMPDQSTGPEPTHGLWLVVVWLVVKELTQPKLIGLGHQLVFI